MAGAPISNRHVRGLPAESYAMTLCTVVTPGVRDPFRVPVPEPRSTRRDRNRLGDRPSCGRRRPRLHASVHGRDRRHALGFAWPAQRAARVLTARVHETLTGGEFSL